MRAVEGAAADDASYVASLVGLLAGPFQAASFPVGILALDRCHRCRRLVVNFEYSPQGTRRRVWIRYPLWRVCTHDWVVIIIVWH